MSGSGSKRINITRSDNKFETIIFTFYLIAFYELLLFITFPAINFPGSFFKINFDCIRLISSGYNYRIMIGIRIFQRNILDTTGCSTTSIIHKAPAGLHKLCKMSNRPNSRPYFIITAPGMFCLHCSNMIPAHIREVSVDGVPDNGFNDPTVHIVFYYFTGKRQSIFPIAVKYGSFTLPHWDTEFFSLSWSIYLQIMITQHPYCLREVIVSK
ncbi:hypothetical protein SDC9_156877 [bioreactor metagenome]|uniref:Uncharacterized protein n=1 Tax=bioreactor metagenome TaxID=1076179 RepID=A0A645F7F9_9ZZZZ